jgi:leader peptidase (prepilin peptidase) / N-methyltransferase
VTAALVVICALLGLAVGSFLNVVIYRVPRGRSIVAPRSACPTCAAPISNRDNVPLVSWLVLRGRCRNCGEPISFRYPLVEVATAALFAGVALRFGATAPLPAYLVLVAGLLALACIDVELRLLPRSIVYVVLGLVAVLLLIASASTSHWRDLWVAAASSAGWFGLFYAIYRIDSKLIGFGDVRLSLVLGLGLGWLGWVPLLLGFFAANLLGLAFSLALIARRRWHWSVRVPYGTFLALGTAIAIFVGPSLHVHWRR